MIDNISPSSVRKTWIDFAHMYNMDERCSTHINKVELLGKLHNDSHYPFIILPETLIEKLNKEFKRGFKFNKNDNSHYYLVDFIDCAKKLDPIKFKDVEYEDPPTPPWRPEKNIVPETKTITVTNNHLGCWITILIIMVLIGLIAYSIIKEVGFAMLYPFAFLPVFLYAMYQAGLLKSEKRTKVIKISDSEIFASKREAEKKYQQDLDNYIIAKNSYYKKYASYELRLKANIELLIPYIDSIFKELNNRFKIIPKESAERSEEVPQKGRSEDLLFAKLMKHYPTAIKIDMRVGRFYPDLCLIIPGIAAIDIEIDEPYVLGSKKETHYLGGSDKSRDSYFSSGDWYVIRFTEKQIMTEVDSCVSIITNFIQFVKTWELKYLQNVENYREKIKSKKWTKEEARLMAIEDYRDTY